MTHRIHYFDQMKGVAILLVVIGHLMQFSFGYETSHPVKFLYFHMPIFFYISGFFAYKEMHSLKELGDKLLRRGLMLLMPYVVFLSLWCVFSGYANILGFMFGGGERYWFLYTLFIISSFFLVYEYVVGHVKKTWAYVMFWIIPYIVLVAIKFALRNGGGGSDIITGLVNYYRYYLVGYMCRKYMPLNKVIFGSDVVAALGFVAYFLNWYFFECHNMLLIFGGSLGAIIVIQRFLSMEVNDESRVGCVLSAIGKQSLAIYVIHYFLIPDVSTQMHDFLVAPNAFIWQLSFAFMLSVPIVATCMFVGKLIETNKILDSIFFGKFYDHKKK